MKYSIRLPNLVGIRVINKIKAYFSLKILNNYSQSPLNLRHRLAA